MKKIFASSLLGIEDGEIFEPLLESEDKILRFERHEDSEDGTFPRVSDYTRLANRLDNSGASEYLNWLSTKNKLKIDVGPCVIIRKHEYDNEAELIFDEPVEVVVGYFDQEKIIRKATIFIGEFTHDWFWLKSGRQNKIANGFEINFICKKFKK